MTEKVAEYIDKKEKELDKIKRANLIKLGLFKREFSDVKNEEYPNQRRVNDNGEFVVKYFKYVIEPITDEEYDKIMRLNRLTKVKDNKETSELTGGISMVLYILFALMLIASFILLFHGGIGLLLLPSAFVFYALAKILQVVDYNNYAIKSLEKDIKDLK